MSDSTGSGLPPAGWYDDPENPGQHRYWDGQQWTDQRRPAPGSATPPAPPSSGGSQWPSSQGAGYGAPSGFGTAPAGQKPDPWLWQSIVATLLCCLPLGVVGIIFAAQSQSAWNSGNAAEAQDKADKAKLFTLIAVGVGVLAGIIFFFAGFAGISA